MAAILNPFVNFSLPVNQPLSFWNSSFRSGPTSMKILSDTGFFFVRHLLLVFTRVVCWSIMPRLLSRGPLFHWYPYYKKKKKGDLIASFQNVSAAVLEAFNSSSHSCLALCTYLHPQTGIVPLWNLWNGNFSLPFCQIPQQFSIHWRLSSILVVSSGQQTRQVKLLMESDLACQCVYYMINLNNYFNYFFYFSFNIYT